MKKLTVLVAVCAFAAPAAVFAAKPGKPAKTKPEATETAAVAERGKAQLFAKYDTNKNGTLEADEIEAIKKDFDASTRKSPLKRLDANKDGKLSEDEIKSLQPAAKRGGKKGKKTVAAAKPDEAKPAEPEKKPEAPK
ncbi:MAG: hypothetical protein HZA93_15560 [Verrucomicrobia bacterium]|nr:hypothetical protein [Verrucomicrobiota bacterium]